MQCASIFKDDPPAALRHLRLHNGTIWRWNRPLIGFDQDSTPHLRIEHRVLPAGPTICDMIANEALYLGLARYVALSGDDGTSDLSFADALHNFYEAVRYGLDATIVWPTPDRGCTSLSPLVVDPINALRVQTAP